MLNERQSRFLDAYKVSGNASDAARLAGYAANSAHVEGHRLLRNPKVKAELDLWKEAKRADLSKGDFVSVAMKEYELSENPPAVRIRSLELAGKALGHLGGGDSGPQTVHNTQINVNIESIGSLGAIDKWEQARKLLQ